MADTTFTIRLDETLKEQFTAAAKSNDRNSSQLIRDFMRSYVGKQSTSPSEYNAWFQKQVEEGIKQADAGELVSEEEMQQTMEEWRRTHSHEGSPGRAK